MKKNEMINIRQLCIFYFIFSLSIKILSLPSVLTKGAGNLAWVSALIGAVIEVALVFLATILLKKLNTSSKIFKVLCFIFVPVMAFGVWITCTEIYNLAYVDLFTGLNVFIFVLTLIFIGIFFITREPRAFFRSSEILWLFFALGLIVAIVPTLYNLKIDWKVLVDGDFTKVMPTLFNKLIFFESAIFIFIFGAETKRTDSDLRKINLTAIFCGVGYVLFVILFVILFGPLAHHKTTAIVNITTASKFITNDGALDWLIASSALMMLILRFGAGLVAVVTLIKKAVRKNG